MPPKSSNPLKRIFMSGEEKRQEAELNRDVQLRMGKSRLRRHITRQKQMEARLLDLAQRALALNDDARFRQLGRQLLWTRQDINRWERYILSMEMLEARRDQAIASMDLLSSVKAMSESMSELASPKEVAELQHELQEGLARAQGLDERMSVVMEMLDESLSEGAPEDDQSLADLEKALTERAVQSESAQYDREIEDGLRKIREELQHTDRR